MDDGQPVFIVLDHAAQHVEFATLAHETTHLLLHIPADRAACPDLTTRETEAEAATWLLCAQLGIAGTEASVEYIQSYRGKPDTPDASLERIRANAQRLSAELGAMSVGDISVWRRPDSLARHFHQGDNRPCRPISSACSQY